MKRLVLPLLFAGVVLWLGVASAGAEASTTTVASVDFSFSDTSMCGFELDHHLAGTFKDTSFFDSTGTLVKLIETNMSGPFRDMVTNPANGKTATSQSETIVSIFQFNPDGSVKDVETRGIFVHFVLPGMGSILMDLGHVVFDQDFNPVPLRGPHQVLTGDVATFCAAMT
jgi:hypothetical protein